jgi:FAD/FMN-containing dehydrogenase
LAHEPATLRTHDLEALRRTFGGDIVTPRDDAYDGARRLWNAVWDRRPAAIVRPRDAGEVATAIRFGRDVGLEIAVRSGGHSPTGHSSVDGGLVIDMSGMRGVTVDPGRRLARAKGGALLGELDVAAQAHGLACPVGVVGHTGVAGLTLGGGVGRLQRNFGLTIDNVAAVELVTADGRHIRASEDEEPELFWGMRGAGWNFGVVTAFDLRLHPFAGTLNRSVAFYPGSQAGEVWAAFREYARTAPDTVACIFGLDRAGPTLEVPEALKGRPVVYVAWNHSGGEDEAERDTAGLRTGPEPVAVTRATADYLEVQTSHDLVLGWGGRSFLKGANADDIRPEALDSLVDLVGSAPGAGTFSATMMGGAIARVDEDATAYAGRSARFDLSADASWDDAGEDDVNRDWVRRAMAVIEPDTTLGRYANENADAGPEESRLIYGDAKLARLAVLKRAWDPDNVFHLNHNVAPAG